MQWMFDVGLSGWVKTRHTTASAVFYFQGRSLDFVGVVCTCFGLGFLALGLLAFGFWRLGFGRLGVWALGVWVLVVWASAFGLQSLGFSVWASGQCLGFWRLGFWRLGFWRLGRQNDRGAECSVFVSLIYSLDRAILRKTFCQIC